MARGGYSSNRMGYLNSGISFYNPQDPVGRGITEGLRSVIEGMKFQIAAEEKQQKEFSDLIDLSLKDVEGKYLSQALNMKGQFIANAGQIYAKAKGMPTIQNVLKLKEEKEKIIKYIDDYKAMKQARNEAIATTAKMYSEDEQAANTSLENITKILEGAKTPGEAYDRLASLEWYEQPIKFIDYFKIKSDAMKAVGRTVNRPTGQVDHLGNPIYETITEYNQDDLRSIAEKTWKTDAKGLNRWGNFAEYKDWEEFMLMNSEQNKFQVRGQGGGGGQGVVDVRTAEVPTTEPLMGGTYHTKWDSGKGAVSEFETELKAETNGEIKMPEKREIELKPEEAYYTTKNFERVKPGEPLYFTVNSIIYVAEWKDLKGKKHRIATYKDLPENIAKIDLNDKTQTAVNKELKKGLIETGDYTIPSDVQYVAYLNGFSREGNENHSVIIRMDENVKAFLQTKYNDKLLNLDQLPLVKTKPDNWATGIKVK